MEADDYHSGSGGVSHSSLEVFMRSIPEYHGRYITKTIPRPDPTPSMILGTALHARILERDKWDTLVGVAPEVDRRTKDGKESWATFLQSAKGKAVISSDQFSVVAEMEKSVLAHEAAAGYLAAPGESEKIIRWTDPDTGIVCKAKVDRLAPDCPVIDLKTASDPTPDGWAKAAANYGYHRQAAMYLDARWYGLDQSETDFLFIVVGTQPPYEVGVYSLGAEAIDLGRRQNQKALAELKVCKNTGVWKSRFHRPQTVSLPRWAYTESLT
jgi:hypothetical protein